MDNLLASIRQAIDNDLGQVRNAVSPAPVKGTMNEMRVRFDTGNRSRAAEITQEINELRSKIGAQRLPDELQAARKKTPFAQIMAGELKVESARTPAPPPRAMTVSPQPQPAEETQYYEDEQEEDYAQDGEWQEQAYLPAPEHEGYEAYGASPIISDQAAEAANSSFNQLADALMARAMGERSIEEVAHELLRTMLRNWLDMNLPGMVERLVREEIERVARRGR
jgi:uncharacterized protein